MCLSSIDFTLKYNKEEKCFVGYGYKSISVETIKEYGDKWVAASGNKYGSKLQLTAIECADSGNYYWPGFHIFLDMKDAYYYSTPSILNNRYRNTYCNRIVKVMFKNVVGFGKNTTNNIDNGHQPCIIARNMKVVEIVKPRQFSHLGQ